MDIKRSDISLMISLDILLEELNVTHAAKRLHLSQPALSSQLSRLRQIFNDPLLVPSETGKGMIATQKAFELQPKLHQALLELHKAISTAQSFNPQQTARHFILAMNDSLFTMIGISMLQKLLMSHAPNIQLSFIAVPDKDELLKRMERGEIDLYVGLHESIPVSLHSRHLLSDHFRIAAKKGHKDLLSGTIDIKKYCNLYHALVSKSGELKSPIDKLLETMGYQRKVMMSVASYNQIPLILEDTDCIATLPSRFLQRYASSLDLFDIPFEFPSFDLAMAWHPHMHEDEAHRWLRDFLLVGI